MAKDTVVSVFRSAGSRLGDVYGAGFNLHYDSGVEGNGWLEGRTAELHGGGVLKPATEQQRQL